MSRRKAQRRQTKIVVTSAGAALALLLALVFAVAASGDSSGSKRLDADSQSSRLLRQGKTDGAQKKPQSRLLELSGGASSSSEILSQLGQGTGESDTPLVGPPALPRVARGLSSTLSNGEAVTSQSSRGSSAKGYSTRGRSTGSRGRSSGRSGGFGGSGAGGGFGGGIAQQDVGLEPADVFEGLLPAELSEFPEATEELLASIPNNNFRRGAPLPEGFDPCRFGELVVSPCVMSSTAILQELDVSPLAGFPEPPRIVFFNVPTPGNGGGSGNGGSNGGGNANGGTGNGGLNGGGNGANGGSNGGGNGGTPWEPYGESTPVPVPAPIFMLGFGLVMLLRRPSRT